MDVEKRAEEFRESVKKLGARGRTTPYPAELRNEAVDYARERRGQGATWSLIAQELGLGIDSLTRWVELAGGRDDAQPFRRVALKVGEPPAAAGTLVLHGPGGVRVEGLDVATVAELLRRLS
jgi:transposase-like protein